ncbi:hypothetical protein IWZ00DRAFT_182300 [Phyllosticta capitalensis]
MRRQVSTYVPINIPPRRVGPGLRVSRVPSPTPSSRSSLHQALRLARFLRSPFSSSSSPTSKQAPTLLLFSVGSEGPPSTDDALEPTASSRTTAGRWRGEASLASSISSAEPAIGFPTRSTPAKASAIATSPCKAKRHLSAPETRSLSFAPTPAGYAAWLSVSKASPASPSRPGDDLCRSPSMMAVGSSSVPRAATLTTKVELASRSDPALRQALERLLS